MIDLARIANLPLFATCPRAALTAIAAHASERDFSVDEVLFSAGSPSKGLFVVLEGKVRVVVVRALRELVQRKLIASRGQGQYEIVDRGALERLT